MAGAYLAKSGKSLKSLWEGEPVAEIAAISNVTKKVSGESRAHGSTGLNSFVNAGIQLSSYSYESGSASIQTIKNKFPNDNQAGKRFNYTLENGKVHIENGIQNVDFIIDMDDNLHIGRGHSFLSGGSSVQAAGTMKVN